MPFVIMIFSPPLILVLSTNN